MSKRIVVGLDPSEYSEAAQNLACTRAKFFDGTVIGIAVVDEPGIERAAAGSGVGAGQFARQAEEYHLDAAEKTCAKLLKEFETACELLGVPCEPVLGRGSPADVLVSHSFSADLVVIGTRTFFHSETQEDPGDTLRKLLDAQACPVLIVPKDFRSPERVIFPYDGSVEAARSMRMFHYYTAGLPLAEEVLLVHITDDREAGEKLLEPPRKFFEAHGRKVEILIEAGEAKDKALALAKARMPAMVVLGASTKGQIATWLFGGVTDAILDDGTIPVFIAA